MSGMDGWLDPKWVFDIEPRDGYGLNMVGMRVEHYKALAARLAEVRDARDLAEGKLIAYERMAERIHTYCRELSDGENVRLTDYEPWEAWLELDGALAELGAAIAVQPTKAHGLDCQQQEDGSAPCTCGAADQPPTCTCDGEYKLDADCPAHGDPSFANVDRETQGHE